MRRFKLTTQINLIFTLVTVSIGLIFIFILEFSRIRESEKINSEQLYRYYEKIDTGYKNGEIKTNPDKFSGDFNAYIVWDNGVIIGYNLSGIFNRNVSDAEKISKEIRKQTPLNEVENMQGRMLLDGKPIYYCMTFNASDSTSISSMVLVFTNEAFIDSIGNQANTIVRIVFIVLIVIGNIIILMWSRSVADRIGKLEVQIKRLSDQNYEKPIITSGNDEISDLGKTVDEMRQEIEKSEKIKQEMLQNLSHDFKTPISVIKSYAEAISDGVSDPKEAEVIIKQAEALNQKVHQLLELNKLTYLKGSENFEEVKVKEIITNVVNNHKYQSHVKVFLDLDDSTLFGLKENFYVILSNIFENGLRYAKTKIIITLKDKRISFYNDGEPIDDKYIKEGFKPYEKGSKGQFGLGMSIVQKTALHFNLKLSVENINGGVMFIIEPIEEIKKVSTKKEIR